MWTLRDLFMALSPEYRQQMQMKREQKARSLNLGLQENSNYYDWMRYERPGLFNYMDEDNQIEPATMEEFFHPKKFEGMPGILPKWL